MRRAARATARSRVMNALADRGRTHRLVRARASRRARTESWRRRPHRPTRLTERHVDRAMASRDTSPTRSWPTTRYVSFAPVLAELHGHRLGRWQRVLSADQLPGRRCACRYRRAQCHARRTDRRDSTFAIRLSGPTNHCRKKSSPFSTRTTSSMNSSGTSPAKPFLTAAGKADRCGARQTVTEHHGRRT